MSEGRLHLKVVTPVRVVVDTEADEVTLPGALGALGILPGHAPLLATLGIGELSLPNRHEGALPRGPAWLRRGRGRRRDGAGGCGGVAGRDRRGGRARGEGRGRSRAARRRRQGVRAPACPPGGCGHAHHGRRAALEMKSRAGGRRAQRTQGRSDRYRGPGSSPPSARPKSPVGRPGVQRASGPVSSRDREGLVVISASRDPAGLPRRIRSHHLGLEPLLGAHGAERLVVAGAHPLDERAGGSCGRGRRAADRNGRNFSARRRSDSRRSARWPLAPWFRVR